MISEQLDSTRGQRSRSRLAIVLASAAVLVAAGSVPAAYAHGNHDRGNRRLSTTLTGANERPGPGDEDGRGRAQIKIKQHQVCFEVSWRDIAAPTAGHIHKGAPDVAGPVVVGFFSVPGGLAAPVSKLGGCAPASAELITDLRRNPRDYYVNIHNAEFPGGAIRGQLR